MNSSRNTVLFPPLPLVEWEATKNTLHLFLQVVGKVRLYTFPKKNHWWHVPFYPSVRGLTTGPIPLRDRSFELEFDFNRHVLSFCTSTGLSRSTPLQGQSVATFFQAVNSNLDQLGIEVNWKRPEPFDVPFSDIPFEQDDQHATYQSEWVHRFWQLLVQVDSVFHEFRGRFLGKSTLPHLFWHHMDLSLTWFSGRKAPARPGVGVVEREAYSHEVISFGFWAGDQNVPAPAFYAYAAPPPEGLFDEPLTPAEATWNKNAGMALMMADDIRQADDPRQKVLDFLEGVYLAGARRAEWDVGLYQPGATLSR